MMDSRKLRLIFALIISFLFLAWFFVENFIFEHTFFEPTPLMVFFLVVIFSVLTLVFYVAMGLLDNEEKLRKNKKWDAPNVLAIYILIMWVFFVAVYYLTSTSWVVFFGLLFTVTAVSSSYLRNIYRKQRNM